MELSIKDSSGELKLEGMSPDIHSKAVPFLNLAYSHH